MPIRLAVSGATGRMGRALAALAAASADFRLVGGIARSRRVPPDPAAQAYGRIEPPESARAILEEADVLLDFSAPEQLARLLAEQAEALAGRALVVGTTGLGPEHAALLDAAARQSPVVVAANFSVGANVLLGLVERAAHLLPAAGYDVEIVEAHHRRKADAPSGTALELGRAVAAARGAALEALRRDGRSGRTGERPVGEVAFHAVRGGDVVGEHRVLFLGARERLELAHAATDRAVFAEGALLAARWAAGRPPGRYGMADVLGG